MSSRMVIGLLSDSYNTYPSDSDNLEVWESGGRVYFELGDRRVSVEKEAVRTLMRFLDIAPDVNREQVVSFPRFGEYADREGGE